MFGIYKNELRCNKTMCIVFKIDKTVLGYMRMQVSSPISFQFLRYPPTKHARVLHLLVVT